MCSTHKSISSQIHYSPAIQLSPLTHWHKMTPVVEKCSLPFIRVVNPMTHEVAGEGRYTTYDICIQTKHAAFSLAFSSISRRFSEFVWLRKKLQYLHSNITPPRLPSKCIVGRFGDDVIQERQEGLEQFLNSVIRESLYLSDTLVHLFLQTDLSLHDLTLFLHHHMSDIFLANLWATGGRTYSCIQRHRQLTQTQSDSDDVACVTSSSSSCSSTS